MIDYDFYINSYLGSVIPEKAFDNVAQQAEAFFQRLRHRYRVLETDSVSVRMALCAIAEELYAGTQRDPAVTAASMGKVSVRYDSSGGAFQRRLLEKARIYLDIYRGATA